jgi:uncharacterized protein YjbI with pentapeptide repeats
MNMPIVNATPNRAEIDAALAQHHIWVASGGEEGTQMRFISCDLSRLYAVGRDLRRAVFLDCCLDGAIISMSHIDDVDFSGSSFKGASITACYARNASFSCCLFEKAQLFDNCFYSADFSHARLIECNLSSVDAREAKFCGALIDAPIIAPRPDVTPSDVSEVDEDADSPSCTFAGADFRGAVFHRVHFLDYDLTDAKFSSRAAYTTGLEF